MDRVTRQPLMVNLGGTEYPFAPKCIRDAEIWRKRLHDTFPKTIEAIPGLIASATEEGIDTSLLQGVIPEIAQGVEGVLSLMKLWEPMNDWKKIESTATEEELLEGFLGVLLMAFPLFKFAKNRLPEILESAMKEFGAETKEN